MELTFDRIYFNLSNLFLPGFIAISLSFALVGIKELKSRGFDGLVYIVISLFFIAAHFYFLFDHALRLPIGSGFINIDTYLWLELFMAPVTITVFILQGLFGFIKTNFGNGMIKIFFGLTLFCYMYMLGAGWPIEIKCSMTLFWLVILFSLEIKPVVEWNHQVHLRI